MLGKVGIPEQEGIIPRSCREIFKRIDEEEDPQVVQKVDIQVAEVPLCWCCSNPQSRDQDQREHKCWRKRGTQLGFRHLPPFAKNRESSND